MKNKEKQSRNCAQRNNKTGVAVCSYFATFHICHICHISFALSPHTKKHPIYANNITPPRTHKTQMSAILSHLAKYKCETSVSYLYFMPFLGIWANVYPPTHFAAFTTTLPFLNFYM